MCKIIFQYRWYEIRRGEAYHYRDVNLTSLKISAYRFGQRHNRSFRITVTSLTSAIVERTK